MKPSLFSRKLWFSTFVVVVVVELFALVDEWLLGVNLLDPLSDVVRDQTLQNPETFGTAGALLLLWMLIHFYLWPLWRKARDSMARNRDPMGGDE